MLSTAPDFPKIIESFVHLRERLSRGKRRRALREEWGQPVARLRDFGQYAACLTYRSLAGRPNYIDGQTWSDLNLDAVFASIDRTISSPGEIELYRSLRHPERDEAPLLERDRVITLLQGDARTREEIQLILQGLGRFKYAPGVISLLWGASRGQTLLTVFAAWRKTVASLVGWSWPAKPVTLTGSRTDSSRQRSQPDSPDRWRPHWISLAPQPDRRDPPHRRENRKPALTPRSP
jgi:hypothetical protein